MWRLSHICSCQHSFRYEAVQIFMRCCNVRRFECKSDGQYLGIEHVSLENSGEEPNDSDYTGPVC